MLACALGSPAGMATAFVLAPAAILMVTSGSLAERIQIAGGWQLIVGFFGLLAGAWGGDRSAGTWRWLIICLSVDLMLGAGAVALAAAPIIVLEVLALGMDVTRLTRKAADTDRQRIDVASAALS